MRFNEGDEFVVVENEFGLSHAFPIGELVQFIDSNFNCEEDEFYMFRNERYEEQLLHISEVKFVATSKKINPEQPKKLKQKKVKSHDIKPILDDFSNVSFYKIGDQFMLAEALGLYPLLKVGQLLTLISINKSSLTLKDNKGSWYYIEDEKLKYYDKLAYTDVPTDIDELVDEILQLSKEQYINKCLEERNFDAIKGAL